MKLFKTLLMMYPNKNLRLRVCLFIFGVFFVVYGYAQDLDNSEKISIVQSFLQEAGASDLEKTQIQCELHLLFDQYEDAGKTNSPELLSSFNAILSTYRQEGILDVSHRISEVVDHVHTAPQFIEVDSKYLEASKKYKKSQEYLDFVNGTYKGKGKSVGGDDMDKSSSCGNVDFETGGFSGWELQYSKVLDPLAPGGDVGTMNNNIGNHTIMGPGAGMDPNTGNNVPRVYPGGGQYSMRLGDQQTGTTTSAQAAASYTFTVTPDFDLFIYHYAVVLQDAGHSAAQQPFLAINLYVNGQNVSCGEYYQAASGNAPGYSTHAAGTPVRYKNWTTVSIALTDYVGEVVTVVFHTRDCTQRGHYGYAYVDAECASISDLEDVIIDCDEVNTIEGPAGASGYIWTGPGIVGPNNQQNVQVDQPGAYEVTVIPVQGPACAYKIDVEATLGIIPKEAEIVVSQDEVCLNEAIDFSMIYQDQPDLTGATYTWDMGDGNIETGANPNYTYASPGVYNVSVLITADNECNMEAEIEVTVLPRPVVEFTINPVCEGDQTSFTDQSNINTLGGSYIDSWDWSFGNGNISSNQNPTQTYATEGIYSVTLTATSNFDCESSTTKTIEIYPLPEPDFTSTTICFMETTSFTNQTSVSNAHTTNSISDWAWDFGDGNTSTSENPSNTYAQDGTYDVTLTATSNRGCVSDTTIQVVVLPKPIANFDFDNSCEDDDVQFTNTSTTTDSGFSSYFWDVDNDGNTDYTTENASHNYPRGHYSVRFIVENNSGCRDTITQTVTSWPLPDPNFTFDMVCEDATTTFNSTSSVENIDGDTNDEFSWDFGNNSTSSVENPTLDYGVEGIYDVTLTVTTNHGCVRDTTIPVAVYPLPNPLFTSNTICLLEITEFLDQSSVSNAYTTNTIDDWSWDFDDGNSSTDQNPSNTYGQDGTYDVTLTTTTNRGCVHDTTIQVVVLPKPAADFDFVNSCEDAAVHLESTSTTTDSGLTDYFWDVNNDGNNDYMTSVVDHAYGTRGDYIVRLIVENASGCRDTISKEVTVWPLPDPNFTFDNVCEDASTTFVNTSTVVNVDNDQIDAYHWDFGNGGALTEENPVVSYGVENIYNVTLTATTNHGCVNQISKDVAVYPLPIVDFIPTDVCLDFDNQFTDQSTVSNSYTANAVVGWSWDFDDGGTASIKNPQHRYDNDGTYEVTLVVTTNNNCVNSKTKTVSVWPSPVASFTGINLEGCSPVCPVVTSTSTVGSPSSIVDYKWTLSDGTIYNGNTLSDCFENLTGNTIYYGLTLQVTTEKGCISKHTENNYISVYHNPIADFYYNPHEPDVLDNVVTFTNTSSFADSYDWEIDGHAPSTATNPVVEFATVPGSYYVQLTATTFYGCVDSALAVVNILDRLIFYVPNTFTPDKDDYNEVFLPIFSSGYDPYSYTLEIYNRWGEILFESHDVEAGWDGTYGIGSDKIVQDGTYIWKMKFKLSGVDEWQEHVGHINLIR